MVRDVPSVTSSDADVEDDAPALPFERDRLAPNEPMRPWPKEPPVRRSKHAADRLVIPFFAKKPNKFSQNKNKDLSKINHQQF
jgi:hypothetical protein